MRQETAALRDFERVFDRFGSFATKAVKAIPRRLSALPQKRTFDSSCGMPALCQEQTRVWTHSLIQ